jgi:pimeloyl-ACP methyl ester carboxylesterase
MSSGSKASLSRHHTSEDERSSIVTATDWTAGAQGTGQYAEVNGINLYFETHGAGRPMLLLHGGLGSGEMFGPTLPALAERRQVIVVDLQGHGRTADIDRPLDVRLMADDIAALIDHLGPDQPDLVGYSLGGWVALHTAAKYPVKVGRLVAALANIRPDAIYPDMRAQQRQVSAAAAEFMTDTPMYQLYQRVAHAPRTSRGCWTRSARRWRRSSTSPRRSAVSKCRR